MQRKPLNPHYERQFSMNCDVSLTKRRTRHSPGCLFVCKGSSKLSYKRKQILYEQNKYYHVIAVSNGQ